jgi:hypothetical protein
MKLKEGEKVVIGRKVYKGEIPDKIAEAAGLKKPGKTEKKADK